MKIHFSKTKSSKTNFANWGINYGFQSKTRWGAEIQLQYIGIRSKVTTEYPTNTNPQDEAPIIETRYRYSYLRAPILAHYQLTPTSSKIQLHALAGVNIGVLLVSKQNYVGINDAGKKEVGKIDAVPNLLNTIDFGVQGGLRATTRIAKNVSLFVDASYYYGIINRENTKHASEYLKPVVVKNQYLTTNIGLKLEVGKKNKI